MSKTKILLILTIIICIALSLFAIFHFRNGTYINSANHEDISFSVTPFCQDDIRWRKDSLGNSPFTMEKSGCLTTCIATALSHNSKIVTPRDLNLIFSENNVYDSEGNLQWSQLKNLSLNADVISTVSEDLIYNYLKDGKFPIVRVRVNGFGNFHYVLIVGIKNEKYICMDPLKDELTPLSDYFNIVYAIRAIY